MESFVVQIRSSSCLFESGDFLCSRIRDRILLPAETIDYWYRRVTLADSIISICGYWRGNWGMPKVLWIRWGLYGPFRIGDDVQLCFEYGSCQERLFWTFISLFILVDTYYSHVFSIDDSCGSPPSAISLWYMYLHMSTSVSSVPLPLSMHWLPRLCLHPSGCQILCIHNIYFSLSLFPVPSPVLVERVSVT